jgi:hypothetical protein
MAAALETAFESPGERISSRRFGSVFATHFRDKLTVDEMKAYANWQREVLGPDDEFVSLSLLLSVERIPDDVRDATAAYIEEFGRQTRMSATIIAVSGFAAAAGRAMLAGLYMISPAGFPRKVFADIDSARDWLAPRLDDASELERAVEYLRGLQATHEQTAQDAE